MLRPLWIAVSFLTALPVRTGRVQEAELGRSTALFPLVGAVLGSACAGLAWFAPRHLDLPLSAAMVVGTLTLLTRGLHLDGLADTIDGLSGGRGERERALRIMRDPSLGAHGAAALVLGLLFKTLALIPLLEVGATHLLWLFPVVSRTCATVLVVAFPYAASEGLGKPFRAHAGWLELALASALCLGAVGWVGPPAVVPALVGAILALGFGSYVARKLGGLTGDVYGAAIELSEVGFLIAAAWRP